jgi:hypothetical protein
MTETILNAVIARDLEIVGDGPFGIPVALVPSVEDRGRADPSRAAAEPAGRFIRLVSRIALDLDRRQFQYGLSREG